MPRFLVFSLALNCAMLVGLSCCGSLGNSGYLYQTAGAANDHIMLVGKNPDTFGFQRLQALSVKYPDLAGFMAQRGLPRYYAETKNAGDSYFILYYPKNRQAFACRSISNSAQKVEFSGPYPITHNELATLRKLEAGDDQSLDP
jgi:hypothetical protein